MFIGDDKGVLQEIAAEPIQLSAPPRILGIDADLWGETSKFVAEFIKTATPPLPDPSPMFLHEIVSSVAAPLQRWKDFNKK